MQFWVYILRCNEGTYYTGHTDDLEKRLWEHREGKTCDWTRRRLPVELVWCDWIGTRYEALEFERRVKNWSRAKKEALVAGDWTRVGYFARPPHARPSTSLGTNEVLEPRQPPRERPAPAPRERPSTSLGTNQVGGLHPQQWSSGSHGSFVPSEAEGRAIDARAGRETGA